MLGLGINLWNNTGGGAAAPSYTDPTSIASCVCYIDASNAASISEVAGAVSQINDLSGNGNHFVQESGSSQPITGTRTINSLNVLDMDGSNDFLYRTDALGFTGNPDMTIMLVSEQDDTSSTAGFFFGDDSTSTAGKSIRLWPSDGSFRYANGNQAFDAQAASTPNIATWQRASGDTYGDGLFYRDGVAQSETGSGNPTNTPSLENDKAIIGAELGATGNLQGHFNGKFASLAIYNAVLSDADLNNNGQFFDDKWGITWTDI